MKPFVDVSFGHTPCKGTITHVPRYQLLSLVYRVTLQPLGVISYITADSECIATNGVDTSIVEPRKIIIEPIKKNMASMLC